MLYSTVCLGWNLNFIMLPYILILLIFIYMYAQTVYIYTHLSIYIRELTDMSLMSWLSSRAIAWFNLLQNVCFSFTWFEYTFLDLPQPKTKTKQTKSTNKIKQNNPSLMSNDYQSWGATSKLDFWKSNLKPLLGFLSYPSFPVLKIRTNITKPWPASVSLLVELGL